MESFDEPNYVHAEEPESSDINLRDYFLILLKRRWLILSVLLLAVAGTAIYCLKQTPLYRSKAVLYFENRGSDFLQGISPNPAKLSESFVNSQITILKSKALALRVIDELGLQEQDLKSRWQGVRKKDSAIKDSDAQRSKLAEDILEMMQVNPVPETSLINLVFLTPDPQLSKVLANTWADEFRDYSGTSAFEMTHQAEQFLAAEVKGLQADIAQKQKILQDYSLKQDVFKLKGETSIGEDHLRQLNGALTNATQDRIAKQAALQEIQSRPKNTLLDVTNNSEVQRLSSDLATLERSYSDKLKIYKPDYPEISRTKSEIEELKVRIQEATDRSFSEAVARARADYNEAVHRESALKGQLNQTRHETALGYQKEIDYDQLKQEIDNKKQLLSSLMQKRNQAGVSAQVQEKMPTIIKIIERAEAPMKRYSPNIQQLMLFSVLFGLIGGVFLALVMEFLDRSLKGADDVEKYIQVPLLGIVPQFFPADNLRALPLPSNGGNNGDNLPQVRKTLDLVAMEESQSVTSEAMRTLRTSLLLSFPSGPPRSILVTSTRPGEGKTFIASNLAVTLSQLNKNIVLIDADLRNPRIHRVWGLENGNGLTNFLTTQNSYQSIVQQTNDPRISVITSGSKSPRPAELLASARFDELLAGLQEEFDHIIVDSPPLLPVTDPVLLAAKCNTVLLVIRGGETPRDLVQQAKKKLMKGNPSIAGAVLNCINLQDPYYYYSYYSYYKGYYGEATRKPPVAPN